MGRCNPIVETVEEDKLIAAAMLIMRELESNKKLSNEAMKILSNLGARLASMGNINYELSDIKKQIDSIHDKVMTWEVGQSMIWDSGRDEANEYYKAVDDIRRLVERLENLNPSKDSEEHELLRKANDVLQTSMARIEEEFKHLLVHNRPNLEPARLSFSSIEDTVDDPVDDSGDSISGGSEAFVINLINPQVIPFLESIANLMLDSNYGTECCQAFVRVRRDALADFLFFHEVDHLSIQQVWEMDSDTMNSKIRRWTSALKIFVRIYLPSEEFLCEQIFGQKESVGSFCFLESSKGSILRLLNFAEAITVRPHQPEKLFRILDMYDVLAKLTPDIEYFYHDDKGSYITTIFQDVLIQVGNCVTSTFLELKNAARSNVSNAAFPGGGIYHLTRYVMNYIRNLVDYSNTLNSILKTRGEDQDSSSSKDATPAYEDVSNNENSSLSPMGLHLLSLMSDLETNLEEKSRLYKDYALRHLFLMNNIHYMAQQVKESEVRTILGYDWIQECDLKFQQHAMCYVRSTWNSILNLLRYEGFDSITNTRCKERLGRFYTAFEDIYESQTGWLVPYKPLCDDLRISISQNVVLAYQTFVGMHASKVEKYIKYSADDLENYLCHLFEGCPRSLHNFQRK